MTDEWYTPIVEGIADAIDAVFLKKTDGNVVGIGTLDGTTSSFTVTIPNVTLTHGTLIAVYNPVGANVANATLNVNALGAKPLYNQATAITAGRLPVKSTVLLLYNTTLVATGCWQIIYSYGANSTYSKATTVPIADTASGAVGSVNKYALADHSHPKSSIYAESSHSHSISDVTNLQSSLDGKASSSHTHTISQLSNASTVAVTVTYTDSTTETITFLKQS
jgi:hypothetical protein